MAQNVNSVVLVGNLTKDVELRSTSGGTPVGTIRLAVNDRRKVNDEWTDVPYYFNVTVWGKQAESCAQYLSKGRACAVQGRLTWREYETKDGQKREAVEVTADTVQFLGGKQDGASNGSQQQAAPAYPTDMPNDPYAVPEPAAVMPSADDDIPF